MKFIYLDKAGNQVGPVDESAVVQAIFDGQVTSGTAVRNALLREFRTAADFQCFAEALSQAQRTRSANDLSSPEAGSFAAFLGHLARKKQEDDQNAVITAKLHAGDAKAFRRLMAMLLDMIVLMPFLALLFVPAVLKINSLGTPDAAELARQKKAAQVCAAVSREKKQSAEENQSEPAEAEQEAPRNSEQNKGNLLSRILPRAQQKLDDASRQHNRKMAAAGIAGPAEKKQPKPQAQTAAKTSTPSRKTAGTSEKNAAPEPARAAYLQLPEQDRPKVLVQNMPGGSLLARVLPSMLQQWEDQFYADGNPDSKRYTGFLITGMAWEDNSVLVRTGNDIRRIPLTGIGIAELLTPPLKWAALVVLLYYTLAFSIFAQTVGMWFWGIFLTRKMLAEVLPFRAIIYAMLMILFGILMIPMVLLTRRSLADWLCGVRQVGVASVSKN